MKILVIAATPFFADRGCHLRIHNEALGLVKRGHEVQICTYHHGQNVAHLDVCRIPPAAWYQKTAPGFAWGKIWLDWKLFLLVKKRLKTFSPDLLHCHLYEGLAIGWLANLFSVRKIPLVADLQGDLQCELENYNAKNWLIKKITLPLVGFFLKKAQVVLISSQRGKEILQKKYPQIKNVNVIQDGISRDLFACEKNYPPDKKILGELKTIKHWKGSSRLLIYAGGLSPAKGLLDFFHFFGKNFSSTDNWKFLIFGSGEEKKFYQKEIENHDWQDKIFLAKNHGYFQLPFYLQLADIAIDPKNNSTESSGKLPVYMAAGLPILCFKNSFNQAKLDSKGLYFKNWTDLKNILTDQSLPGKPIVYNLEKLDNQREVSRLEKIMKNLVR